MKKKLLINVTQSLIKHFKEQNYHMLNEWLGRTFPLTSRHSLYRHYFAVDYSYSLPT